MACCLVKRRDFSVRNYGPNLVANGDPSLEILTVPAVLTIAAVYLDVKFLPDPLKTHHPHDHTYVLELQDVGRFLLIDYTMQAGSSTEL
jgi:hypothetical protein